LEVGAEGGFKLDLRLDYDPGRQDCDPGKQELKGAVRTETYRRHYCQHVYYNRDLEKERKDLKRENRKDKGQETHMLSNMDRQAILGGSAPGESCLQDPAPFVGENIGRHTVPGSQGNQGHSLPPNDGSLGLSSRLCNHHKSRGALG
jgi:hypothetical protein